jgi:hypothetical protein
MQVLPLALVAEAEAAVPAAPVVSSADAAW